MKFNPGPYARRIRKDNAMVMEKIRERRKRAILEANPAVRRVFFFDSLAERMPRNLDFDIDLAMDGGDIHEAMDLCEDSPFKVDIVELGSLPELIRRRVLEKGRELSRE